MPVVRLLLEFPIDVNIHISVSVCNYYNFCAKHDTELESFKRVDNSTAETNAKIVSFLFATMIPIFYSAWRWIKTNCLTQ